MTPAELRRQALRIPQAELSPEALLSLAHGTRGLLADLVELPYADDEVAAVDRVRQIALAALAL
jgi:hypothetical protein